MIRLANLSLGNLTGLSALHPHKLWSDMESKLKELIGQPNVWIFIRSSNGWFKNVQVLDVNPEIVTFRYEHESETEKKIWEKTTRLDNIAEIDIRLLAMPKCDQQVAEMKDKLMNLLEQEPPL